MHLLVVEDDPRLSRVLKRLLEEDRHVVEVANDGASGLEILFIRRAEHPRDPWSGQIEDGLLHGRGSVDMKGAVVAALLVKVSVHL